MIAAVFDVVSAADGNSDGWARELYRGGTFVLMVSTAVMALTILSGLIDRSRGTASGSRVRARANVHGAVMGLVAVGSIVDLTLRREVYPDAPHAPAVVVAATLVTFAVAVVGGEMGGRLTYKAGVNVARSDGIGGTERVPSHVPSDVAGGS
jgi:uncharacterized membrane protein